MKTLISVMSSWACATGVVIVSSYCIATNCNNTPSEQKRAAAVASRIANGGTISEYKSQNRHSSALKKTTTASVTKVVKKPVYVANPIYPSFTNALSQLTEDVAAIAQNGEVKLRNGFVLMTENGKPRLKFPEEYGKVVIGGVAMGADLRRINFRARTKRIEGAAQPIIDEVELSKSKRLGEPEFYCTSVTYSLLPATRQVYDIRMHGDLTVGNESKARKMVREVTTWLKEDFGAVDRHVDTPADMLALKKFKIGRGMEVEVSVKWKHQQAADQSDASIDISFTTGELVEESRAQRQELGDAAEAARVAELGVSGVNYYTVRSRVNVDEVNKKVVWWSGY